MGEVVARLVRPEEHPRWDTLMDAHPYLGFKQFVGRGLRYAAEWNGEWLALLGWQTGVLQCRPRNQSFCAPVHNTRLLVLPQGEGIPNLASRGLAGRLGASAGVGGDVCCAAAVPRAAPAVGQNHQPTATLSLFTGFRLEGCN